MTYQLSKAAENDIIDIFLEGALMFGVEQANLYHEGLEATFKMLAEYPQAGREQLSFNPPVRLFSYRSHLVVYSTSKLDILILRVLNGRQDWESILS